MLEGGVKQVVVWAVHHEVIDDLLAQLHEYGVSRLDGGSSPSSGPRRSRISSAAGRASSSARSRPEARRSRSRVENFPCRDIVFAETSFSPSDNYQAACRIHRIGQNDAVLARFASAAETYDDRIQDILARKTRDFTELFEGAL